MPFAIEQPREGADYVEAAFELFAGFLADAVNELQVVADHPLGCALGVDAAAEELEGGSHAEHYAVVKMRFQPGHEFFLLGGSEGNPNNVGTIFLDHAGYCRIVEVFNVAKRQFYEFHVGNVGVGGQQVLLQAVESGLLGAEKYHAVFARGNDVMKNLAAAVLAYVHAVDPFEVEGHVAAVADGEHAAVDHLQIIGLAVGDVENNAVGHADIVRTFRGEAFGY